MASRKSGPVKPARAAWIPPHFFSFCLLTALVVLTYANSLHGKFVFDDLQIIQQNSSLMNVKTFGDAVPPEETRQNWTALAASNIKPHSATPQQPPNCRLILAPCGLFRLPLRIWYTRLEHDSFPHSTSDGGNCTF
jgi:hypothetical protein